MERVCLTQGSEYYPGDKYTVEDDHTFTAVWEKKSTTPSGAGREATSTGTTARTTAAKTGDPIPIGALVCIVALSALSLVVAFAVKRRKS